MKVYVYNKFTFFINEVKCTNAIVSEFSNKVAF